MTYLPGFRTYLDFDFTTQQTQTINSDGSWTIGGMTWTKGNSAHDATAMSVTNGTGLVIQPVGSSNTDYNGSSRTLPYLWLPFNQIPGLSTLNWQSRIRVWAYNSADNLTGTFDNAVFGVDSNSTALAYIMKRGYGTSSIIGSQGIVDVNSTNTFFGQSYTLNNASRIMVLDMDLEKFELSIFYGTGSIWPDPSALTFIGHQAFSSSGASTIGTTLATPYSTMGVFLGAQRFNSGTSLSITFSRIRVDILQ